MSKRKEMKPKAKAKAPPIKRVRIPTSADAFVSMPDAVVDGDLKVPVGGGVAFVRWGAIHRGWVHGIHEMPRGVVVDVWDETEDQFFSFNLQEALPDIKDTGDRRRVNSATKVVPSMGHEEEAKITEESESGGGGHDETPRVDDDPDAGPPPA